MIKGIVDRYSDEAHQDVGFQIETHGLPQDSTGLQAEATEQIADSDAESRYAEYVRLVIESGGDLYRIRNQLRDLCHRLGLDWFSTILIEREVKLDVIPKLRELSHALARKVETETGLPVLNNENEMEKKKTIDKIVEAAEEALKDLQSVEESTICIPYVLGNHHLEMTISRNDLILL